MTDFPYSQPKSYDPYELMSAIYADKRDSDDKQPEESIDRASSSKASQEPRIYLLNFLTKQCTELESWKSSLTQSYCSPRSLKTEQRNGLITTFRRHMKALDQIVSMLTPAPESEMCLQPADAVCPTGATSSTATCTTSSESGARTAWLDKLLMPSPSFPAGLHRKSLTSNSSKKRKRDLPISLPSFVDNELSSRRARSAHVHDILDNIDEQVDSLVEEYQGIQQKLFEGSWKIDPNLWHNSTLCHRMRREELHFIVK